MAAGSDAGNEFWVTLPLKPVPRVVRSPALQARPLPRRRVQRTHILLVEDVLANQLFTAAVLRQAGHHVDTAGNGAAAVAALRRRPYDLVLMDVFMPRMSGLDTTRAIRGLTGPPAQVPIVALTANVGSEDETACLSAGMNGVLVKPVDADRLLQAVTRFARFERPADCAALGHVAMTMAGTSVLSPSRLDALRAALPAKTLAGLVDGCLAELSDRMRQLHEAVGCGEPRRVQDIAHAMVGISAEYGIQTLEVRLRALMLAAQHDRQMTTLLEAAEAELARAAGVLRQTFQPEPV